MTNTQCPRCGCPVRELAGGIESAHTVTHGQLTYRRCVCGAWLIELGGAVIAAPRKEIAEKPVTVSNRWSFVRRVGRG